MFTALLYSLLMEYDADECLSLTLISNFLYFKAKETYNEAICRGHTSMLLSEDDHSGDIFECNLGNLPAGETAMLTIS